MLITDDDATMPHYLITSIHAWRKRGQLANMAKGKQTRREIGERYDDLRTRGYAAIASQNIVAAERGVSRDWVKQCLRKWRKENGRNDGQELATTAEA